MIKLMLLKDLDYREVCIFIPLIIGVFWIGVYPESFSIEFRDDVASLILT